MRAIASGASGRPSAAEAALISEELYGATGSCALPKRKVRIQVYGAVRLMIDRGEAVLVNPPSLPMRCKLTQYLL